MTVKYDISAILHCYLVHSWSVNVKKKNRYYSISHCSSFVSICEISSDGLKCTENMTFWGFGVIVKFLGMYCFFRSSTENNSKSRKTFLGTKMEAVCVLEKVQVDFRMTLPFDCSISWRTFTQNRLFAAN